MFSIRLMGTGACTKCGFRTKCDYCGNYHCLCTAKWHINGKCVK